MNKQELLIAIEDMYNIAYASLIQEEYHIKQELVSVALNEDIPTATAISHNLVMIDRRTQRLKYEVERLFELRNKIYNEIKAD